MKILQPRDWSLSQKITGNALLVGAGVIAVMQWYSVTQASKALLVQEARALEAVRTSRAHYIQTYFDIIEEQMRSFARNNVTIEAMAELTRTFHLAAEQENAELESVNASLKFFYEEQYRPRTTRLYPTWKGHEHYLPESPSARVLQSKYISENVYRIGEKRNLDAAFGRAEYHRTHKRFHPFAREFIESFGYYDIFLFDVDGNLVYSVIKESDFASNFLRGAFRDTNLAEAFRRASESADMDTVTIVDFARYEPTYGATVMFIATPIFSYGRRLGVAAIQLPIDRVNRIMGESSGLGKTGETFLVGPDFLMRSQSHFDAHPSPLNTRVPTKAVEKAFAGESGTIVETGYRGREVLASFAPINFSGVDWVMVAEIDMDEIIAPATRLRNQIIVVGIGLVVLLLLAWQLLARRWLINPVNALVGATERVRQGDYSKRVKIGSSDEIGQLGDAFNHMSESIARDITRREAAEATLAEETAILEATLEYMDQGIFMVDSELRLVAYNRRACELLDLPDAFLATHPTSEEIVRRQIESGEFPDAQGSGLEQVKKWMTPLKTLAEAHSYERQRPNGIVLEVRNSPLPDGGWVRTFTDITQRKQAEQALQENEEKLRTIIDNLPVAVFLRDVEGRYIIINSEYESIYKVKDEGVRGKTLFDALDKDTAEEFSAHDREVINTKRVVEHEITLTIDGQERIYVALSFPVLNPEGKVIAVGGIEYDITDRKALEETMARAREAADEANRAKSEFLSNMSHELRTPLNGVLGYVQILQKDSSLSETQRECLEAIDSCGKHLLALINDVLDLSRIESGHLDVDVRPSDLHVILKSVQDILRPRAEHKGLKLYWDIEPQIPRGILTDGPKLRQVLVNLLGNAVKFTNGGAVSLDVTEAAPNKLRLAVHDTGVGMSADELEVIFDAFKQVEGGKVEGGTGLGLAISRKLTEALGGELTVESEQGTGTTFTLTLPLVEAELLDDGELQSGMRNDADTVVLAPGQSISVLITDDRAANRDILKRLLTQAGFSIVEAEDGVQALERLAEQDFALVLMDIRMPRMNGVEAVQRIREDANLRDTVVIAVSASVFPDSAARFSEEGFDDFIAKPLRAGELFEKIARHLDVELSRSGAEPTPVENATTQSAISPERARAVAARLREAAAMGDVSTISEFATELRRDEATCSYGETVEELAKTFDLDAIIRLADELAGVATSDEEYR